MKCNYKGVRNETEATVVIKVIDLLSGGRLKIEINRKGNIAHQFHVVKKNLNILIFKLIDNFRHGAANV